MFARLVVALIVLNRPRVNALIRASVPPLLPSELDFFKIPYLQTLRANDLLLSQAKWQRSYLRRLDRAEHAARVMGIDRAAIRAIFGHPWVPASMGPQHPPQPDLYDAVAMLDLPERGKPLDPAIVQQRTFRLFHRRDRAAAELAPSERRLAAETECGCHPITKGHGYADAVNYASPLLRTASPRRTARPRRRGFRTESSS